MSKEDYIVIDGEVTDVLPNSIFRVKIPNGLILLCHLSGKLRKNSIKVILGDKVKCEISQYDLTRGRISYRYKN